VNPADLAEHLDGDPGQGHGIVDLQTGIVWPPGITDYDPPPELDQDSAGYDEDRWLSFAPESGQGYRDMLKFTDYVNHEQRRQRLMDALSGRGAFRTRFRATVGLAVRIAPVIAGNIPTAHLILRLSLLM
jgi:hypothetical protein